MKRIGNLYHQICSTENLQLADSIARKGKLKQYGVIVHDRNREANIIKIQESLINKTYRTSPYSTFTIFEPKEREIYRLPYYPDRIVHHAIMNVLEPVFVATFTANTYSCIKGRGIHAASYALRNSLKDTPGSTYYLKFDIKKFYPSIDHVILKQLLRRKFKDADLLWLLDDIIDSTGGLPIGNYLSQYLANFYLSYLDHHIKEVLAVKSFFRYADDYVILSGNKAYLHQLFIDIRTYLEEKLCLIVKSNYRVAPVAPNGIDFVGYVHFHTHVLLRKTIKQNFARMVVSKKNAASIASYKGWSPIETFNDINSKVVNFFEVLRSQPQELIDALLLTPYSKKEYADAWYVENEAPVERVRKFFIRTQQSIWAAGGQDMVKGWAVSINESRFGKSEKVHKWINAVCGLPEVVKRFSNVQIECRDYKFILSKYDAPETFFYLDPPYDGAFRSSSPYEFDFVNNDFFEMHYHAKNAKGKVAISGYNSPLMIEIFKDFNFIKGPHRKNTRSTKEVYECLWTNY